LDIEILNKQMGILLEKIQGGENSENIIKGERQK
jgi:hypothetical protein